jgi:hypothetical protein
MVAMSARIISRMAKPAASSAALLIRRPEDSLWTLVDNRTMRIARFYQLSKKKILFTLLFKRKNKFFNFSITSLSSFRPPNFVIFYQVFLVDLRRLRPRVRSSHNVKIGYYF